MRFQMTYELQMHVEADSLEEARTQIGDILAYVLSPDEFDSKKDAHIIRPPRIRLRSVIDSKRQPVEVKTSQEAWMVQANLEPER